MYLVEGWVKPIPPVLCIVVVVVVAGEGQNPKNEHERSFRGCPMAAVVMAARKEMRIEMN